MPYNFIRCDREQVLLLPPSMLEWLPEDHLALFILDAVSQIDISQFYAKRRSDGWGRAAFEPSMMVSLMLYAYAKGVTSSRKIETACAEDIAFRVISANQQPDHATVARFRKDNEKEIKNLFVEVLKLCADAGLVKIGRVALDGTKFKANAALAANRTAKHIEEEVEKILAEAAEIDAKEDARFGKERRGDELPDEMRNREDRLKRLRECKKRLDAEAEKAREEQRKKIEAREAEEKKTGRKKRGRKPKSVEEVAKTKEKAKANVTDPDSRILKTQKGHCQGYNAQAVVTEEQVIVAAEITQEENDLHQLHPMLAETEATRQAAGIEEEVEICTADAGYCTDENLEQADPEGPELYVATTKDWKERKAQREAPEPTGPPPSGTTLKEKMEHKLRTSEGREIYKKRSQTVEPVFGQIKSRAEIFMRRGLKACQSEWLLLCATHNLLKLWRSGKLSTS
jgi:transposase